MLSELLISPNFGVHITLFPFFFGCIANKVARMDHAYLLVRFSEINEDRIFVKRQIVFSSEGFADCLRSQQDSRFGRYGTFVSGMLPHDLHAAFIDVVERKDLSPDDAQQAQGKFVFAGQISTLVAVCSFVQLFLQPFTRPRNTSGIFYHRMNDGKGLGILLPLADNRIITQKGL